MLRAHLGLDATGSRIAQLSALESMERRDPFSTNVASAPSSNADQPERRHGRR